MAFTRKFLSALGIESEKIDEIMNSHIEVVEALKNQIAEAKTETEKLANVQAQLDETTKKLTAANEKLEAAEKDDYKGKYESEKAEHDKLKADVASKETIAKKETALKAALKKQKYSDEASNLIIRKGGYTSKIELDENGNVTNIKDVFKDIQSDFSMLTPKETVTSSTPDNPPTNSGGRTTKTKSEIMSIKDSVERQKAIKESIESGSTDFYV